MSPRTELTFSLLLKTKKLMSQLYALIGSTAIKKRKTSVPAARNRKYISRRTYIPRTIPPKTYTFQMVYRSVGWFASDGSGNSSGGIPVHSYWTNSSDATNVGQLFDEYRVNMCEITFLPIAPFVDQGTTPTVFYRDWFVAFDPDSSAALTSVAGTLEYDKVKMCPSFKRWSYRVYPERSVQALTTTTLSTQGGWRDVNSASSYTTGIIMAVGDNFKASTTFGDLIVNTIVEFKTRR